jgi:N-acetylglucosamine malate deacetylase 2
VTTAELQRASERARTVLAELAGTGPILQRLLIVVAHPDDETVAIGGQFWRMREALLVHITDGAPRDGEDARRHGFTACADYAAARREELAAALIAGQAVAVRTAAIGLPDKEAVLGLAKLSRHLLKLLEQERPAAVLTHAYEGGHPDHDAAAFATHSACRLLAAADRPAIIEMPFYHAESGEFVASKFLSSCSQEITIPLAGAVFQRKQEMVNCFYTQREILGNFGLSPERFRHAPAHEFREPPHPGTLLYETWGWGITGKEWRRYASSALETLGLS